MAKYALVACEVMRADWNQFAPLSENEIDIYFMDLGLHAVGPEKMSRQLQERLDTIPQENYDAILLGYGLCSNGVATLYARVPIVIPRAHDCVTLFMGSKEKYREYFYANKGTYYLSPGSMGTTLTAELLENPFDINVLRAEYLKKYDEEEAEFLLETLGDPLKQYQRIAFVNNGVGNAEEIAAKRKTAENIAAKRNWSFDEVKGDTGLLRRFLDGAWDSAEFLVVLPGEAIAQSFSDEEIVKTVPVPA